MYKVGDRIKIVRVSDRWKSSHNYSKFLNMIGQVHIVMRVDEGTKSVILPCEFQGWYFDEIELDKNYYVTEILKGL